MAEPKRNRKVGGRSRARTAKDDLQRILTDSRHPDHLAKDIDLSAKYNVSRHTIYKIRKDLGVAPRPERIRKRLAALDTTCFTIKEISIMLNIKYQNLYKILNEEGIPTKADTLAIEHLKQFQKKKPAEVKT